MAKIIKINNESLYFNDGTVLASYHERDCCEYHYIAFEMMQGYNIASTTGEQINIYEVEFDFSDGIPFKKVEGVGILLIDTNGNKYLCNGYGSNNGYYNSNITLIYYKRKDERRLDYYIEYEEYIWYEDVSKCQDIEWG